MRLLTEFGMGTSLRRGDYTQAAKRAVQDALWHNSINLAELFDFPKDAMQITVEIAVQKPEEVDVIVMHAPGTIKGDLSEHNAIEKVFGNKLPFLTTNKWKIGHTFGASGMLSIELALLILEHQ